ncbi:ATP-binding protein [Butyrivibrio sp. AE3004]|uniref:ATP-binding protein n=1 Tax=Butyrivibrio sp. AE3004 TaxID=1506994 RepID=UPI00068E04AF|nr:ATP-binding protein [Butyrivibrio sp. AE3004]
MRNNRILKACFSIVLTLICIIGIARPVFAGNNKEKLTVGVPVDRCPIFYLDSNTGEIVGIGVDLMRAVAKEAGYDARFVVIKEATLKEALDNYEYDVLMPFGSAITSAEGKASIVSDNLLQTPFTLVTMNNHEVPPINELKVGMLSSLGGAADTVRQMYPGIEISFYGSMAECVQALMRGKVDALLHNSYVWSYVLQKPTYSKLIVQPSSMFSMDFRIGAVDTEKKEAVIEKLNEGIRKVPDTRRQAIILDYTNRKLYRKDFFDYIYEYGLILAVFVAILLFKIRENYELKKAQKVAEDASNAKSLFLANMSHEIRTPINTIMGMGEMISRESRDSRVQQYAYSINRSANSLLCLIDDILDFARMEAGKLKLRNDPYHLSSLITDVNVMIKDRAENKNLEYNVNVNQDIPDELVGDETRLKQVIINLLTNAVKYTATGSVDFTIDYEKIDEENIDLKITVKDTGIGMKKSDLDRLFNAFERLDQEKNKTIEGAGLGMSIVKQILDAMGSTLDVQSVYDVGSVFSFSVRQKVSRWEKIADFNETAKTVVARKSRYRSSFIAPEAKILIVDDTDINLKVVTGLLEPTRMKIDTASSGKQALKLLEKKKYDILMIDYRMPEMDGLELLKHIKKDLDSINYYSVCIVLTANAIEGAREMFIKAGFDEYLEKPINGRQLEDMLLRFLPKDLVLDVSHPKATEAKNNNNENKQEEQQEEKSSLTIASDELVKLQEEGLLNVEDGIGYSGAEELYLETLEIFRDSVEEKADEIEELCLSENIEDYTIKIHALKCTARIIGARGLFDKAKLLEDAGKRQDFDFIRNNNDDMLELYRKYKDALDKI